MKQWTNLRWSLPLIWSSLSWEKLWRSPSRSGFAGALKAVNLLSKVWLQSWKVYQGRGICDCWGHQERPLREEVLFLWLFWSFLWLSFPSCIAKKTGLLRVAWSFANFPMKELIMEDQIIKIKGEESQRWPIPHGFLIKDTILFADDTTLAVSGSDPDRASESANLCQQEYRR